MARKSDIENDEEFELEDELEDEFEDENEDEAVEAKAPKAPKPSKKHPLPDTHVTPVGFTKVLKEQRGVEVRPQIIYGYTKSAKSFPHGNHTDGRVIIPVEEGLRWWDERMAAKAAKAAEAETASAE